MAHSANQSHQERWFMQNRSTDPDQGLIAAMASGDVGALHELYARHGMALLNLLIHEVGERNLAEEVLQDVMMAAWQGAGRFRGESQVRTWLVAIAKRQASKTRERCRLPEHTPLNDDRPDPADQTNPAAAFDQAVEQDALRQAIRQLPLEQQEALELVFFRGMSGPDAASQLGVPLNTLKSRLHRARQSLRQLLGDVPHAE
ncbi:MAG: sigma-70 family RNA polymerase sigma factor [Chloroflexi bacterium]|nr:sigma-70 family RNA polymerase sigma factor [Chloroflexota bacterium]